MLFSCKNHITKNCYLCILLSLLSCTRFPESKHQHLKNLTPRALEIVSQPIDDFLPDSPILEDEEDDDLTPTIDKKFYNKISISTAKDMSIINLLARLAELANINIIIAPEIEGNIACSAKNRPFINVLQDVCESANLRYTINGDSVKIEYDSPVLRTYNIQFLNIQRDMKSSMATSTDIFTDQISLDGSTKGNNSQIDNGSSSLVTGNIKIDFWEELSKTLMQIIGDDGHVSMHKQGGLISVYTTQNKQNAIKKYLKLLKQSIESQVLIEAKILEVSLNDENKGGINWNILRHGGAKIFSNSTDQTGLVSFGINRTNLEAMVGIIEQFGAVKTLSNPRITVLNNQSAILKVVTNEVICIPSLQKQYATTTNNSNFDFMSTTLHTIPIGLIMSVVPSIDRKNNTVLLNLRPTISHIIDKKNVPFFYPTQNPNEPNTTITTYKMQEIPVVDVKEFDSVLKLNSGQVVVMGGLMHEESRNERKGLPKASDLDFLFGARTKSTRITELVIFLKATILNKRSHHASDEKLYKMFANDPRPLNFKEKQ